MTTIPLELPTNLYHMIDQQAQHTGQSLTAMLQNNIEQLFSTKNIPAEEMSKVANLALAYGNFMMKKSFTLLVQSPQNQSWC